MDNTLTGRCMVAYTDAAPSTVCNRFGIRGVIEHLAAELTLLGHTDAARCLLAQLQATVVPFRRGPEDAA
jgi:hypothetical protein